MALPFAWKVYISYFNRHFRPSFPAPGCGSVILRAESVNEGMAYKVRTQPCMLHSLFAH